LNEVLGFGNYQKSNEETTVCPQLSRMTAAAKWIPARKFLEVLSSRVAVARYSLRLVFHEVARLLHFPVVGAQDLSIAPGQDHEFLSCGAQRLDQARIGIENLVCQ
jgi:hypothetical protein